MSHGYILQTVIEFKQEKITKTMSPGKTKRVRFAPEIGMMKVFMPLAPKSPGLMDFIYVGEENTKELVKAYSCGMNAKIIRTEFWLLKEAKKGWIPLNGLHLSYWHGSCLSKGRRMKDEMNWDKFIKWWAPKQLAIELDYWKMEPNEPAHAAVARCLP